MSKLPARPTIVTVAAKSSRKKNQPPSVPEASAQRVKKLRSLTQILSLGRTTVSIVDRDLAESRLAIHSIIHSAGFSQTKPRNKNRELDATKPKKELSPVKSGQ